MSTIDKYRVTRLNNQCEISEYSAEHQAYLFLGRIDFTSDDDCEVLAEFFSTMHDNDESAELYRYQF